MTHTDRQMLLKALDLFLMILRDESEDRHEDQITYLKENVADRVKHWDHKDWKRIDPDIRYEIGYKQALNDVSEKIHSILGEVEESWR